MTAAQASKTGNKVPVFIHIEKTGGTSIEKALGIKTADHRLYIERIREAVSPTAWVFTVVRNPFDLVVSKFHWRKYHSNQIQNKDITFKDWCIKAYLEGDASAISDPRRFRTQKAWVADDNGVVNLHQVIRFENIQEGFNLLCDNLGRKRAQLPHINKTERSRDYRLYYDNETFDIIEQYFKEDLEYWGYSFDK